MNTNAQKQISGIKNRSEQASTERSQQRATTQTKREDYRQAIDRQQQRENRVLSTANVLNLLMDVATLDTPDKAAAYWRRHITTHPYFNPECECFAVLLLNTRRRVKGHHLVSVGIQDTILVHAREVFRVAIVTAANALIALHNHPSGESSPSEADIRCVPA